MNLLLLSGETVDLSFVVEALLPGEKRVRTTNTPEEREKVLPVVLQTLVVMVQRPLDAVGLPEHLQRLGLRLLERPQVVVRRLEGQLVVRRHRGSLHSLDWSKPEPPGSSKPPGSVLLLLQLTETGSLELSQLPVPVSRAVTHSVGLVTSSSALNKTKEKYNTEIIRQFVNN